METDNRYFFSKSPDGIRHKKSEHDSAQTSLADTLTSEDLSGLSVGLLGTCDRRYF